MNYRFITYLGGIYLVVGVGYHKGVQDYFHVVPVQPNLFKAMIHSDPITISFSEAIEITNKNTLINLMVLYG